MFMASSKSCLAMCSSEVWATWMVPGPIRNGWPHEPSKTGISVVKATTVVAKPSSALQMHGFAVMHFAGFRRGPPRRRCDFSRMEVGIADGAEHHFGAGLVGDDVGRTAAGDCADVQGSRAENRIVRKAEFADILQDVEQGVNCGVAQFRIGGMRQFSAGDHLVAQRAFGAQRQEIFRGLAVDQVLRAARSAGGGQGARGIAFFANDEKQSEIADVFGEQGFRGRDHGGDNAFGVAGTASVNISFVFGGREERWNGVHVGGKSYDWRRQT